MIKLFDPSVNSREEKAILQTLRSHYWASGSGEGKVKEFENKFNKFLGTKYCAALNSGTAALHLALSLFDIKNKEVLIPSLSFVSTATAVLYNGGIPVFVDVDKRTLCMDPKTLNEKISKKTKVILPVHFGGMPCNLDHILKICKENNLYLIEDAAHAVGSSYKNKKIGRHGDAVCFSFHPVKNLAMPTGGAITFNTSNSKSFLEKTKSLRWCGIINRKNYSYDVDKIGWNYYMNEFSASIGIIQLSKLNKLNYKRKKIAKIFSNEIKIENKMPYDENCSYHIYWLRIKNRKKFMAAMKTKKIETGIHYNPIHTMSLFNSKQKLPNTEEISNQIVSIPIHANLTDSEVDYIIKSINNF